MKYYNVKDIISITGLKQSKCYDIIRKLNISYKKEYPNAVTIQGCIPAFWFEKAMGIEIKGKEQ